MGSPDFRRDIEGLRALAILIVVACHAGIPGFSGGYVGVDVFFVISGFLITGLLLTEQGRTGRIDVLNFYARRIRRLLPALLVVVGVTVIVGWAIVGPLERVDLTNSAAATSGFVSNIFFWRSQNYFARATETVPLLHTWTLSIEEQFYLAWPVILLAIGALASARSLEPRRLVVPLLAMGIVGSFALCVWMTLRQAAPAFYLAPTRAWEFGLGGLLAAVGPLRAIQPRLGAVVSTTGVALVALSAVYFNRWTLFPGYFSLVPALGAVALIAGGALAPGSVAATLFASSSMVAIGRLSYSWYLWHWPLLALGRSYALGEFSLWRDLGVGIAALGFAALSYHFVEQPVRERRIWRGASARQVVAAGAGLISVFVVIALGMSLVALTRVRNDPRLARLEAAAQNQQTELASCAYVWGLRNGRPDRLPSAAPCMVGAQAGRTVLLWGDSHALHLVPALDDSGRRSGFRVLHRTSSACLPYLTTAPRMWDPRETTALGCRSFNRLMLKSLAEVRETHGVSAVVLASRWEGLGEKRGWESDLQALVDRLLNLGLPVLLVADTINYPFNVPSCVSHRPERDCMISRTEAEAQRGQINAGLAGIALRTPGVSFWDPADVLCDAANCPPASNGVLRYRDHGHLTTAGSLALGPGLGGAVNRILELGPAPRPSVTDAR